MMPSTNSSSHSCFVKTLLLLAALCSSASAASNDVDADAVADPSPSSSSVSANTTPQDAPVIDHRRNNRNLDTAADEDDPFVWPTKAAKATNPPTSGPTSQDNTCREDLYAFKFDERVRTFNEVGNTARNYIPLYGYGPCPDGEDSPPPCPDFSTVIGEYNSVDFIIPRGDGLVTCQQQSVIGLNPSGGSFQDQLVGSGICITGILGIIEDRYSATGGLGIYGGASGSIRFQCAGLGTCTVMVEVCGYNVEPNI
jgi:hypothetical protein